MQAGDLDKRITLQRLKKPHDSQSGAKAEWGDDLPLWAKIETGSGNESQDADQVVATASHTITIRWQSNLKSIDPGKHRVKFGDRVFGIESANNVNEQNRYIVLACTEVK